MKRAAQARLEDAVDRRRGSCSAWRSTGQQSGLSAPLQGSLGLYGENGVRPVVFNDVRVVEPMAVVTEVPKTDARTDW